MLNLCIFYKFTHVLYIYKYFIFSLLAEENVKNIACNDVGRFDEEKKCVKV